MPERDISTFLELQETARTVGIECVAKRGEAGWRSAGKELALPSGFDCSLEALISG